MSKIIELDCSEADLDMPFEMADETLDNYVVLDKANASATALRKKEKEKSSLIHPYMKQKIISSLNCDSERSS